MPLFSIPLSGLDSASEALSVISNNLANLNTTGYKDQSVSFQDLFYQGLGTSGSGNPMQIGNGVTVGSVTSNFSNGGLDNTGVPTDMAITGNGFFVTQHNGEVQYTRSGHFTVNDTGQLITQDGQLVMGYPAIAGKISTGSNLSPLNLGENVTSPASATSTFSMKTNLDAEAAVGDSYNSPVTMYDSLGSTHIVSFQFTKTATNQWSYTATLPGEDTGASAPTTVASGTLSFDTNGNLVSPSTDVTGINISGLVTGAAPMSLAWNLFSTNGVSNITQLSSASTTVQTNQNGYSAGTLKSFAVQPTGVIEGTFSNGESMQIGQLAIANFANEQGLDRVGGNSYIATLNSGSPAIGVAGSGGRGTITGGALELSNVDVATEFAKMIVAQRGFEANAKVVTTFDQVAQDAIELKR